MAKQLFYLSVFLGFTFPLMASGQVSTAKRYSCIPLSFLENKGQVHDQDGRARGDIQFKLPAAPGLNIFIGRDGLHYQFAAPKNDNCKPARSGSCLLQEEQQFDMYRLDVILEGADPSALIVPGSEEPLKEHYHLSGNQDNEQTVRSYNRVTYQNIYQGIDWVLYIKNGKLEYDFIVHPGGNAKDIKMRYDGATSLTYGGDGVTAFTPFGDITEGHLRAYIREDNAKVSCNYQLKDNYLAFDVAKCPGTLVVDPTLAWGTYFGGSEAESRVIAKADSGGIYIGGSTASVANIATTGAFQSVFGGSKDGFLAKFDSGGMIRWATYYGGNGNEEVFGIAADQGYVYISGITSTVAGIASPGAYQGTYGGGGTDVFLAKFNSSGIQQWATYYGGSGDELGRGVCLDNTGNVYITGFTNSTSGIATAGAYKTVGGGSAVDAFIGKFTSSGSLLWATYFGGGDDDEAQGIACDPYGNVFITGGTSSSDSIATPGAYQHTYQSYDDDVFLAKFGSAGNLQWGTYYGANGSNGVHGVACDNNGNVYITGSTSCTDSIATPGAYQVALTGPANAFIAKFNGVGVIQWGTYYGSGGETGSGLAVDVAGNIFLVGASTSTTGMVTAGAFQGANAGGEDAYLAQFSNGGSLLWATYYGGSGQDQANGVACDSANNIYITGYTTSQAGIATPGAFEVVNTATGLNEVAFLARFRPGNPSGLQQNNVPQNRFTVFPDPATDVLHISWNELTGQPLLVSIFNMAGSQVASATMQPNAYAVSIPVSELPQGLYVCIVKCGGEYLSRQKFSVER